MSWLLPCLGAPASVSTPQSPANPARAPIDRGAAFGDRRSLASDMTLGRSMASGLRDSLQRAGVDTRGADGTSANIAEVHAISSKFNELRGMSLGQAESLGFRDAAHHAEPTVDLFDQALSLTDIYQKVIGLSQVATDPAHGYDAGVSKGVEFMDMNNLARYLADNPRHPFTQMALNAENINRYAFRVGL